LTLSRFEREDTKEVIRRRKQKT